VSYHRVAPRDLFNESKLLKCVGKLVLLVENRDIPGLQYNYDGEEPFVVDQDPSDGSISVSNIVFFDECSCEVRCYTGLNSRDNWPLVISYNGCEYYPFDENGAYQLAEDLFKAPSALLNDDDECAPSLVVEDIHHFLDTYEAGFQRMNRKVRDTYGLTTEHPAYATDIDADVDLGRFICEARQRDYELVYLFGDDILAGADVSDLIAGLLNIACRAIQDADQDVER